MRVYLFYINKLDLVLFSSAQLRILINLNTISNIQMKMSRKKWQYQCILLIV